MARSKRSSSKSNATKRRTAHPARTDAVALLKADHRQVEGWFKQCAGARPSRKKQTLASQICAALRVPTTIEEEISTRRFCKQPRTIHHDAVVEHDGAKKLIGQIEQSDPADDYFESKVKVLSEMIKHHVKEQEQADGMFAQARASKVDLEELGTELASRKQKLSGEMAG